MQGGQPTIGLIGLGNMGVPMSACLLRAGYHVLGYDISATNAERFSAQKGARRAAGIEDVGRACRIIILMLPDGNVVREVVLGNDSKGGLAAVCAEGTVLVDMSSSAPTGTRELGEDLAKRGLTLIDAPVSGGVKRAVSGTLAIMAGGDKSAIAKVQPVLEAMGKPIETGPLGSGHAMKALNNYVSAAGLVAACEALAVAERFGIEPDTIVKVLNSSTGRNNSTENKLNQFIISRTFNAGFTVALMRKDLATAVDLAKATNATMPLADTLLALWAEAEKRLGGAADHTEIHRLVADGQSSSEK
ncbi:MAG: NAD(P)-dependent oxidoreductase [Hyphomicrobiaceae bacterium]|nr:MAG: NAD(P)-dependent oxidoreductase [Hyphomicrobiaceae bacterium]